MHTELTISNTRLVFDTDKNNWCKVSLYNNSIKLELGADTWEIIRNKLLESFSTPCVTKEPEGVISLFEKHCTLYRQLVNGHVEYFWQNGLGNEIWRSEVNVPLNQVELDVFSV